MAKTIINPFETRTPVRTISSVMRNAPRNFGGSQTRTGVAPINQSIAANPNRPVTSISNQNLATNSNRPVAPISSVGSPVGKTPLTSVVQPKTPISNLPSKVVQPVSKTPVTVKQPVKPIITTPKKPVTPIGTTTKTPVKPITTPTTKTPITIPKTNTSGITSVLNNPIVKTIAGAGAGAVIGKILDGGTKQPSGGGSGTAGAGAKPNAPITSKVLTDKEIQAELDRVKASEESWTPPEGAIKNEDGTYTVIEDGIKTTYNADGSTAGMEAVDGGNAVTGADTAVTGGDTVVAGDNTTGGSNPIYDFGDTTVTGGNTVVAGDTTVGGDYTLGGGDYTLGGGDYSLGGGDYTLAGNNTPIDFNQYTPSYTYEGDGGSDFYDGSTFAKHGGSMHQKRKGGLPRFASGNLVDETGLITDYATNPETGDLYKPLGTNDTGDSYVPVLGSQGYAQSMTPTSLSDVAPVSNTSADTSYMPEGAVDNNDGTYTLNGTTFDMQTDMPLYRDNPNGGVDVVTDNNDGTYSIGDQTYDMQTNQPINFSGSPSSPKPVEAIKSAGSGTQQSFLAKQAADKAKAEALTTTTPDTGVVDALKTYISNNPALAGGAIGALLTSLMGSSGDSSGTRQPVDISELTAITPRTTDFGAGMTGGRTGTGSTVVPYQDYDQGSDYQYTPDQRLYSDLGISGYLNEPEMTQYTDDQGNPVDQSGIDQSDTSGQTSTEEPAMATGGATHYTFGRAIDPAESLGLAKGMRAGGLSQAHTMHSHHTNRVVDNRVDFRKGSAVNGAGDGQSDDIPAWLADGEYVMDAELVSMLGNGSNKAGAKVLDKFREEVRAHKRSAPLGKIPPKAKSPLNYIKESMNG